MGKCIVIKGSDFSKNSVAKLVVISPDDVKFEISKATLVLGKSFDSSLGHQEKISDDVGRALIAVEKKFLLNECPLSSSTADNVNAIALPVGIKKISLSISNNLFSFGLCLSDSKGIRVYDSGWTTGGNTVSVNPNNYIKSGDYFYVPCTLKRTNDAFQFGSVEISELGFKLEVEL